MKAAAKLTKNLKNLKGVGAPPSPKVFKEVQVKSLAFLSLLTSFVRRRGSKSPRPSSVSASVFAPALALAIVVLGISLFSQTAYAASYINVSSGSGGTVSLGSIKPSSTGVSASGSDTLTITTNCSAGYSVYVSAQNGGDTNLTNTNSSVTTNNTISASSTAVGSAATTLNSNTWGITGDSASASASKYVGLPSYADATNTALISNSSASTSGDNKSTVYYGVKVDTSLSPGTYAGDVLYTVLMNNACLEYTLKFDDNGATTSNLPDQTISFGQAVDLSEYSTIEKISKTGYHLSGWKIKDGDGTLLPTNNNTSLDDGESSELTLIAEWKANTYTIKYAAGSTGGSCSVSDTSATYDQDVTLSSTKCTKTNYDQTGWSINQDGSTKDYTLGQTLTKPNLTSINGGEVTLYPNFESTVAYMQDFNCASLTAGTSTTLADSRDNQGYTVYRIPTDNQATNVAGKCIMTKDLNLGAVAFSSTASSKMASANSAMMLSPNDSGFTIPDGSGESITVPTSDVAVSAPASWSTTSGYSIKQYRANGTGDYAGRGYYSWGAAMVSCPKGWRLPTSDELNNSSSLNSSTTGISKAVGNSLTALQSSPYSFTISGYQYDATNLGGAGSLGTYWSSTQVNSTNVYNLDLDLRSNVGLIRGQDVKWTGRPTRCIADPYDGTMQGFDASTFSKAAGASAVLKDTRDGKVYTVKRLPDGKVWMMQNLTIGSDGAKILTDADTNIDDGKTYYLPPAGKQGSSTIDDASTLAATDTANFVAYNSAADQHAKTRFRTKSTSANDSDTGYYNFYTATLGFSYYGDNKTPGTSDRDICPKGWRLPKVSATATATSGTSDSTGDFAVLASSYNSGAPWDDGEYTTDYHTSNFTVRSFMYLTAASPLGSTTKNSYAGFYYSGRWANTNTSASDVGSYGYYWSASVYYVTGTGGGYHLYFSSSDIYPQNNEGKYRGYAVRCVAK